MKIFVGKNKKQVARTWLKYVAAAYLVASWGVNGVISPLHYVQNAVMQETVLECRKIEDGIVLVRPQAADKAGEDQLQGADKAGEDRLQAVKPGESFEIKSGFLSFEVASVKNNPCKLRLEAQSADGAVNETEIKAWKGWNSVPLEQLCGEDSMWESFFVQNSTIESEELRLGQAAITNCRKVEIRKTVYLFGSFLFLAALWEGVWWIRKRYAE